MFKLLCKNKTKQAACLIPLEKVGLAPDSGFGAGREAGARTTSLVAAPRPVLTQEGLASDLGPARPSAHLAADFPGASVVGEGVFYCLMT